MTIAKKGILKTSALAAMGLTAIVGCASNGDTDDKFVSTCNAETINEMKELNASLNDAIYKKKVRWTPAGAKALQAELQEAINNCDPNTSATLIARAEKEVTTIKQREAEEEKKRLAQERAKKENQRYLEMAEKEWEQVKTYDNLSENQQELKNEGKTALNQDKGRKSYNILHSLNEELKNRVEEYVVKDGDTLWEIAASSQIYGNPWQWPAIHDENRNKIEDPNLIYPGQKLMIDKNAGQTELTVQARKNDLLQ
ncbi:LysM peptidoglycan-binding domain-containing protein [Alteromonas sp. ASW11-130]|uniref:LysM peptidoglycan-binding domain-containing protein n=1 Tax=Alteromonas sp. ASW11-130 TaxID=3015775 RepID=UPI002241C100|nr:LysM peptidoglycan-binding domain-containing protein [Alteromonas sp. ASW11-130]MCW8090439.1 LysM peptidoglycan-binding domain-containing protein [Alteromonas sp. ASW11-130]